MSWNALLEYADRDFDDDYTGRCNVVVLAFDSGTAVALEGGPFQDDGVTDSESFNEVIPE